MELLHLGEDSYGELCSGGSKGVPVKHTLLATLLISLFLCNKKKQEREINRDPQFSIAKL